MSNCTKSEAIVTSDPWKCHITLGWDKLDVNEADSVELDGRISTLSDLDTA